jgi:hypothetical protein
LSLSGQIQYYVFTEVEFGGKGEREENTKYNVTVAWHRGNTYGDHR